MIAEPPSLGKIIQARQQEQFVGRRGRRGEFSRSIELQAGDPQRKHLFNIHGNAGIGKTSLTLQLRRDAEARGAVCAFADENSYDVPQTMATMAADLRESGFPLKRFTRRYEVYRDRRYQLEADPQAPPGTFEFVTRMAIKTGVQLAKTTPGLALAADVVDPSATAEQAERLRRYLAKKFRKSDEVKLLLSPADILTPLFLEDLMDLCRQRSVVLMLDTFEQTSTFLEGWLLGLLSEQHGTVPADLTFVVSGQLALDQNRWIAHHGLVADIPLAELDSEESHELLGRLGVHDDAVSNVILELSSGLPLLIAMLASGRPTSVDEVGDRTGDAVERFLKWETDDARRELAVAAALPRALNEDIFFALTGDNHSRQNFDWLLRQPFVTSSAGSGTYHEVVRAQMLKLRRSRSPKGWKQQHLRLAEAFRGWRSELGIDDERSAWADADWQDNALEENYHRLCAAPKRSLPDALTGFIRAATEGPAFTRRWARSIADAGQDADDLDLRFWGDRLEALLNNSSPKLRKLFDELLAKAPIDVDAKFEALVQLGIQLRLLDDEASAVDAFSRAVALKPDDQDVMYERGETYRLLEDFEKAIADFDRALELGETNAWTIGSRGQAHAALGNDERALADLSEAIAIAPEMSWSFFARASLLVKMNQPSAALTDLNRALELAPTYEWTLIRRAEIHLSQGRLDAAQADLDQAVQVAPGAAWPLIERANLALQRGEKDAAMADYTRAIKVDPDKVWALTRRADLLRSLGRETEAIADLSLAIATEPANEFALAQRGVLHGRQHRFDDALADLDRAIEIDSDDPWSLDRRGEFRYVTGRYQAALEDFSRSLEIDPDDSSIRLARVRAAMMSGLFDQAGADLEALQPGLDDDDEELLYYHALYMRWQQMPEVARTGLIRALTVIEVGPEADFELALCHAALGNFRQAQDRLRAVMRSEPAEHLRLLRDELRLIQRMPGADQEELDTLIDLVGS